MAIKALTKLQVVERLVELRTPPSNNFEALRGEQGRYSIRIDGKWRLRFRWKPLEEPVPEGQVGVPPNSITAIINGDRGITAERAMLLGKAFGTGERYWMNLQSLYDAKLARQTMAEKVAAIRPLVEATG